MFDDTIDQGEQDAETLECQSSRVIDFSGHERRARKMFFSDNFFQREVAQERGWYHSSYFSMALLLPTDCFPKQSIFRKLRF